MTRTALAAFLTIATAAPARPEQRPPATFESDITVVSVPVFVTDGKGQAVAGLRAEDFEVADDGRPVRIVGFREIDVGDPGARGAPRGLAAARGAPAVPAALRPLVQRRQRPRALAPGRDRLRARRPGPLGPRRGGHLLGEPRGAAAGRVHLGPRAAPARHRDARRAPARPAGGPARPRLRPHRGGRGARRHGPRRSGGDGRRLDARRSRSATSARRRPQYRQRVLALLDGMGSWPRPSTPCRAASRSSSCRTASTTRC